MDVNEIRNRRNILEKKISELIEEFEETTDVMVGEIYLDRIDARTMNLKTGKQYEHILNKAEIKIIV